FCSGVATPESMPSEALPCAEVGSPLEQTTACVCSGCLVGAATPIRDTACAGVPVCGAFPSAFTLPFDDGAVLGDGVEEDDTRSVSYTPLTPPTIYSV
ncbi:hypothetical protein, partial [Vibrio parahaemolyticus]|uniref:hypothetical protein n=1 Tax=Vibrio parahaemolyticus TaxID=670 RepID=UPI0005C1FC88